MFHERVQIRNQTPIISNMNQAGDLCFMIGQAVAALLIQPDIIAQMHEIPHRLVELPDSL